MSDYHTVYIGLGSNLGNPLAHINSALRSLRALPKSQNMRTSHCYSSKAVGPGEQPDYINAVSSLETQLTPLDLLHRLQAIENEHGRQRDIRWGARTLDLDILLYSNISMRTEELQLPHPEIHHRNFVLYPLQDLSPSLSFPNGQTLGNVIKNIPMADLTRLDQPPQNNEDTHRD